MWAAGHEMEISVTGAVGVSLCVSDRALNAKPAVLLLVVLIILMSAGQMRKNLPKCTFGFLRGPDVGGAEDGSQAFVVRPPV